jgi:predicted transcriptional regulator
MSSSKQARSLVEFVRDEKRSKCKACQIPEELRMQMAAARDKKIGQDIVIKWLRDDHGITITSDELLSHHAAHHDRQLRELMADG